MVKRKILVADEELARKLAQIAEEKGQTLFGLLNDILEQAVRAHNMGLALKFILDEYDRLRALKEAGFVHVVKGLWLDVVDKAYSLGDKRSLLEKWRETGHWYGRYFIVKCPENAIGGFRDFICSLMWGASEFVMEVDNGEVQVRCISTDFPESYTKLLSAFFEGAFEVLGYRCMEEDVSKGLLRMLFKKQ